jgi:hypothetical protein
MAMEDCSDHGWRIEPICAVLFVPALCCGKSVSREAPLYTLAELLTLLDRHSVKAVRIYLFSVLFKSWLACRGLA